jgi:hypothetical protein
MFQFDESKACRDSSENWTMQGYALSPKMSKTGFLRAKPIRVPNPNHAPQKQLPWMILPYFGAFKMI